MDNTAIKIVSYFDDIEEFLIGILFFTLPFGRTASIIPLVLFATMLIINMITKPQKPNKEKLYYFFPLMGLILWELISLFYSNDPARGISVVGTQSVLFIIPAALLFTNIKQSSVLKALLMFLLGCITSVVLLYTLAFYHSSSIVGDAYVFRPFFEHASKTILDTDIKGYYFLGAQFSSLVHPAYMALMLGIAMFVILSHLRLDSTWLKNKQAWLVIFTIFGISIISMSLNASFILIVFIILIIMGVMSTKSIYYGEISRGIYFSILIFIMLLLLNPQVINVVSHPEAAASVQKRGIITQASLSAIQEKWLLGHGIGSEKEAIQEQLLDCSKKAIAERRLNAHNQFLSTWLQGGIPALALLLSSFWALYHRARQKRSFLVLAFGMIVFISFLFESMLNRYWGALTFTLFYVIFFFYSNNPPKKEKLESEKRSS